MLDKASIDNEFGTAFLTTDGQLVTARHCIEPWLDFPKGTTKYIINDNTPKPVMMALEAVTNNILHGDSAQWRMVSYCSLRKPEINDSVLLNVSSEDFIFDNSRDHIVECGDYEHQYFWRSIKVRPHHTDMMLGDIAYLPNATKLFLADVNAHLIILHSFAFSFVDFGTVGLCLQTLSVRNAYSYPGLVANGSRAVQKR